MKRRAFLLGGGAALVVPFSGALATPLPPGNPRRDLVMAESPQQVLGVVRARDASARAKAAASLAVLSVSCPFTRTALAAPIALFQAAQAVTISQVDPVMRSRWQEVLAWLAAHVAVLDTLEVQLPAPRPGDALGYAPASALATREQLVAAPDPLAPVSALVLATPALVAGISAADRERIEMLSDEVEAATRVVRLCPRDAWTTMPGQPWRLGGLLKSSKTHLEDVMSGLDPEAQVRVAQMVELLVLVETTHWET